MTIPFTQGAELPDTPLTWVDGNGDIVNFASGWTFTLRLGMPAGEAELEKTTGITGAATAPNITVSWAAGELDDLSPGTRVMQLWARQTSSGKDRGPLTELFTIYAPVTPAT